MSRTHSITRTYDPSDRSCRPSNNRYPHVPIRKIYAPSVVGRCPIYSMDHQYAVYGENDTELFNTVMKNTYIRITFKELKEFKQMMESSRIGIRWIESVKMWAIDAIDRHTLRRLYMKGYHDMYNQNRKIIPTSMIELYIRPVLWDEPTDDELIGLDIESLDYL